MTISRAVTITQVALFTSADPSRAPLIQAVWTALEDVQEFFMSAGADDELVIPVSDATGVVNARVRPTFKRTFAGPPSIQAPAGRPDVVISDAFLADIFQRQTARGALNAAIQRPRTRGISSGAVPGLQRGIGVSNPQPRTVDAMLLGPAVQTLIQPEGLTLLVTDLELTPPNDWRYIIWDGMPLGTVASIAPLDPVYWGEPFADERERARTVKHRTRAACMSIVGSLVGLERCQNEECFLYFNVDSVTRLDDWRYIGAEHGVAELSRRGFRQSEDPTIASGIAYHRGHAHEEGPR